MICTTTVTTPDGPFTILGTETHVLASGWTADAGELLALVHPGLRGGHAVLAADDTGTLRFASDAVTAYYAGDLSAPGRVPVRQRSTPGREHAWEVLREVAPGEPLSYAQYAGRCGNPAAVRAAAGACARNAAALFVPCHRIIRSDGTLGGFRYGLSLKRNLLQREG